MAWIRSISFKFDDDLLELSDIDEPSNDDRLLLRIIIFKWIYSAE